MQVFGMGRMGVNEEAPPWRQVCRKDAKWLRRGPRAVARRALGRRETIWIRPDAAIPCSRARAHPMPMDAEEGR